MRRDHSGQWEQAIEKLSRFIAELDVDRDHLCFPTKPFYCGAVEDKNLRYRDGNIRSRDRRALHRRFRSCQIVCDGASPFYLTARIKSFATRAHTSCFSAAKHIYAK